MKFKQSIAAVIVTYNRLSLLKEALSAISAQSRAPEEIIVVDNGSTDETASWLRRQAGLTVISQENSGGAGGFFTGIKAAFASGHDWFWCMDDDTIPNSETLQRLVDSSPCSAEKASFLASLVVWTDGTTHRMNVAPPLPNYDTWHHRVLIDKAIPVACASFVSILISREAVQRQGLPIRDFFIWYDDVEYTQRLRRFLPGWLILDSIATHKTKDNLGVSQSGRLPQDSVVKYCYGIRNQFYTLRTSEYSRYIRFRLCSSLLLRQVSRFLRREIPFRVVWWALKGIWFSPKIEFPNAMRHEPKSAEQYTTAGD